MRRLMMTITVLFTILMILGGGETTYASQWQKNSKGWWYQNSDNSYPNSSWKKIGDKWYRFDENGYMQTGWYQEAGKWYFLNADGAMAASSWIQSNGKWYYMSSNGSMMINSITPDGYSVNGSGEWGGATTNSNFCKNVYERYGAPLTVYAEKGKDFGSYYELEATIKQGSPDELDTASYNTIIRIRKNAVVYYYSCEQNKTYTFTFEEYINHFPNRSDIVARLWEIVHDSEGYIIEFQDSDAG